MHLQKWHFPMSFIKIQDCLKFYYTWHLDLTILTVFTLISKLVKTSKKHTKVWWIATKVTFQIQPYLCLPNLQKCIGDIILYWMLISDVWKHFMKEIGTVCPNNRRLLKTIEDDGSALQIFQMKLSFPLWLESKMSKKSVHKITTSLWIHKTRFPSFQAGCVSTSRICHSSKNTLFPEKRRFLYERAKTTLFSTANCWQNDHFVLIGQIARFMSDLSDKMIWLVNQNSSWIWQAALKDTNYYVVRLINQIQFLL